MISDACAPHLFIRTLARSLARTHARSLTEARGHGFADASTTCAVTAAPSPTLSPTDPVPRGLLTLRPWASSGPQGQ